jgi:hypothetical protein
MQAFSMTQIRYLSERMIDGWRIGCPIRWRNEYTIASFSLNVAEGIADKKIHLTGEEAKLQGLQFHEEHGWGELP